jgi:uncharacterized membrane protein YhaH (DUF805 family)
MTGTEAVRRLFQGALGLVLGAFFFGMVVLVAGAVLLGFSAPFVMAFSPSHVSRADYIQYVVLPGIVLATLIVGAVVERRRARDALTPKQWIWLLFGLPLFAELIGFILFLVGKWFAVAFRVTHVTEWEYIKVVVLPSVAVVLLIIGFLVYAEAERRKAVMKYEAEETLKEKRAAHEAEDRQPTSHPGP